MSGSNIEESRGVAIFLILAFRSSEEKNDHSLCPKKNDAVWDLQRRREKVVASGVIFGD